MHASSLLMVQKPHSPRFSLAVAFVTCSVVACIWFGSSTSLHARMLEYHSEGIQPNASIRVVASFTTVPSRVHRLLPMILSVLNQSYPVASIEFNLPYFNPRTNQTYEIPSWLAKMSDRIHIHRTPDYGAITKVAPTLLRHMGDSYTYIWALDDDRVFPSHVLDVLVRTIDPLRPSLLGFVGGTMHWSGKVAPPLATNEHRARDVLKGYGTILYPPDCIQGDFQQYLEAISGHTDARSSDDVTLSNYFAHHDVPRYTVAFAPGQVVDFNGAGVALSYNSDRTALHKTGGGHPRRYIAVLKWLRDNGMLWLRVKGRAPRSRRRRP